MTRTELLALAERLSVARVYGRDIEQAADFLRQIAQAQPVAWRFEVRFCAPNPVSEWRHYNTTTVQEAALRSVSRCDNGIEGRVVPLYTLPLED